ncbi:MAG: GNAT family protein [Desulfuromonadales bacterium]
MEPIILHGKYITLESMSVSHLDGLCRAVRDGDLWEMGVTAIPDPDAMDTWIRDALSARESGTALPFTIVWNETNVVVGTTRFYNIDRENRRLEIGRTWVAQSWHKTAVNTEAKLLLLTHAFEAMQCIRVEFVTDVLNEKSFRALTRIGAKTEGVLRNHMIMKGGRYRDSYLLSIIESEWPPVKERLLQRLA